MKGVLNGAKRLDGGVKLLTDHWQSTAGQKLADGQFLIENGQVVRAHRISFPKDSMRKGEEK